MYYIGKNHYLMLRFDLIGDNFALRVTDQDELALGDWDGSTRVSPIWPLLTKDKAKATEAPWDEAVAAVFLGPVDPSLVYEYFGPTEDKVSHVDCSWLSIGCFNTILFVSDDDQIGELTNFARLNSISCEVWVLSPDESIPGWMRVDQKQAYPASDDEMNEGAEPVPLRSEEGQEVFRNMIALAKSDKSELQQPIYEFLATASAIRSRAIEAFPAMGTDLDLIELAMNELLHEDELDARDTLFGTNAGLSRLASQALSGTTPIVNTECHFWPHSLLGTGIANFALRNVVRFVDRIVVELQVSQAIDEVLELEFKLSFPDTKFEGFFLDAKDAAGFRGLDLIIEQKTGDGDSPVDPTPDPITYYSARDGFRNSKLGMSAPLMSVSGCNSYAWNLVTITHEISHRIIGSKLSDMLDFIKAEWEGMELTLKTVEQFTSSKSRSLMHNASQALLYAILVPETTQIGPKAMDDLIKSSAASGKFFPDYFMKEPEEVLVHIYDFYHFYNRSPTRYIVSVWQSLAIIPSIRHSIDPFIKRTLMALSAPHFGTMKNWYDRARMDFLRVLKDNKLSIPDEIRQELDLIIGDDPDVEPEGWSLTKKWLVQHESLLQLFHIAFKSDELARRLEIESFVNPGKKDYSLQKLSFWSDNFRRIETFTNPLRMLNAYCKDTSVDPAVSAWMLHQLVFNLETDPNPSSEEEGGAT